MNEMSPSALILKDLVKPEKTAETHISVVHITADSVYKLKKPVDFGFLDYTLMKSRRGFCILEKELNDRFSKGIYQEVLKIARVGKEFKLVPYENTMISVDYVLKMKRIADENFLSTRVRDNAITADAMRTIGEQSARLFAKIDTPAEKAEEFGGYTVVRGNCVENFQQTAGYRGGLIDAKVYDFVQEKTLAFLDAHKELFESRVAEGFVKDGHGDLRVEHVYFDGDSIGFIDCIEFNKRFRYNDVVSDLGFLAVELDQMGRTDLADAFMEGVLSVFADAGSSKLVNFYRTYRAYVRLKVACFMLDQKDETWELYREKKAEIARLADMAATYAAAMENTRQIIFCGLMASGKSKNGKAFAARFPVKYINTDVERKVRAGIDPLQPVHVEYGSDLYSKERSLTLYTELGQDVARLSRLGRIAIVDGSFSSPEYLSLFTAECGCKPFIARFFAPDSVICDRLARRADKSVVTDGRMEIYEKQKAAAQLPVSEMDVETTGSVETNVQAIFERYIQA